MSAGLVEVVTNKADGKVEKTKLKDEMTNAEVLTLIASDSVEKISANEDFSH